MAKRKMKESTGDFLTAAKAAFADKKVPFPELGRTVTIKPLTEKEAAKLRPRYIKDGDTGVADIDQEAFTDSLIAACAFDESGKPLIPAGRESELAALPTSVYQRLASAVMVANGYISDIGGSGGNS